MFSYFGSETRLENPQASNVVAEVNFDPQCICNVDGMRDPEAPMEPAPGLTSETARFPKSYRELASKI